MRRALLAVMTASLLFSSVSAMASLEDDMDTLNAGLHTVSKTDDVGEFKKALTSMRGAAEDAKTQTPDKLKGKPADSAEIKDYHAGLDTLIGQIDSSMKLADAGDLAGAKAEAKKFTATRNENHKKFR
ncbi:MULTISPECIES: cytochrome b562 [Erwinia]|jgi:soluble cytochrome b562|uniref:Cytochrome b562 n=1 Tax=Erwinia billingiae (strain Eb661) TaxID=634500 RepID=D8MMD1_ERWBE|nr:MULTISPECIES: cytochrome b562 [Erwinia]MBN7123459.1 cytochrome B562 [Erwinia billingiae]MCX0501534.1 cytochrome B562 [Erwinia billingiae]PRB57183.1 cytochrome B562 [Erwinia billingiae]QBR50234.1 cytochrome b562 [Erwinia sp. QL-Z3]CAX58015.1 Cytochrome b562 [Erwinia billingiae Eb661]